MVTCSTSSNFETVMCTCCKRKDKVVFSRFLSLLSVFLYYLQVNVLENPLFRVCSVLKDDVLHLQVTQSA